MKGALKANRLTSNKKYPFMGIFIGLRKYLFLYLKKLRQITLLLLKNEA